MANSISVASEASRYFIGMLLDADNSIYRKISVFDEDFLRYLPEKDREHYAHHYFCITKKDKENEFLRKNFPHHHCTVVATDCHWEDIKKQLQAIQGEPTSIGIKYDVVVDLAALSKCLPTTITNIYLIGKWDTTTTSINRLKNIINCKNINIIYIARADNGNNDLDNKRAAELWSVIKPMNQLVKVEFSDAHKF